MKRRPARRLARSQAGDLQGPEAVRGEDAGLGPHPRRISRDGGEGANAPNTPTTHAPSMPAPGLLLLSPTGFT